uniref:Uncharacterized protein n=1 Tax=Rhizophora mucronata TaxID=61149 RepID=A0A2P2PIV5_RHIMU
MHINRTSNNFFADDMVKQDVTRQISLISWLKLSFN